MIQLNLLPEVKLSYIKTQRLKHTVISVSIIASGVMFAVFLLLVLTVDVWQKKTISDLSGDIKSKSSELQSTPDLNKILTIQSQLSSLDQLHASKPVTTRLAGYIGQVTPADATISNLTVDYTQNTFVISGSAPSLDVVNTFVDGLKFTNYTTDSNSKQTKAFSNVVLASFSRDASHASYTINLSFDPVIFQGNSQVSLVVPNIISTRSVLEKPNSVFQGVQ